MNCVAPPTHAVGEGRSAPATQAFSLGPELSVAGSWLCPSRLRTSWMETQDNDSGHPGHAHAQLQLGSPGPDRERDVGPKRGRKIQKWEDTEEDDCSVVGHASGLCWLPPGLPSPSWGLGRGWAQGALLSMLSACRRQPGRAGQALMNLAQAPNSCRL